MLKGVIVDTPVTFPGFDSEPEGTMHVLEGYIYFRVDQASTSEILVGKAPMALPLSSLIVEEEKG